MAEVEHWKRMYTESGRDFFLLKYQKIELEKRVNELENQEALRLIDELDLKHLLEDVKIKYDRLLVEFQEKKIECELVKSELKELSESKIGVGNGLKEYHIMCNRCKERRNKSLKEEKRIANEREKKENERITSLEKEIMKMESDQREKCDEFNKEIMELEYVKRRAEDEIEIWKKKFKDSKCSKRRAEDEIQIWKEDVTNLECRKRRAEDEVEIWKQKFKDAESGKRRAEDETEVWKKKFIDSECANRRAEDEIQIWKQEFEGLESERTRAYVEINLLKIKCMELEIQAGEMLNHGAELEDCKSKCHGLRVVLKEKEAVCIDLHHELMVYKTKCNGMEECIMKLTESRKDGFVREKTALERSAYFERCVKKVMSDKSELRVQLGKVIENLKCGRKIAEDENEVLKKKLLELEEYKLKYRGVCKEIKEKEMECAGVLENLMLTKVALDHELEDCRTKCSGMEETIMDLKKE
ncbi:tropomyosin beta chain-like [Papaver somniferum]|uniref:tropomyosin beta chain-like n=1 Tax=Papaver somniferum TaxID=3469 RepID=UPI000E70198A|nr:tropomyosin beta chain-like [Papaver somniferum]